MAKVWRTRYGESQNQIVFTLNAANPGAVVTDSSLAIWVGNNIPARRINEMFNSLDECMKALIERDTPVPGGGAGAEYYAAFKPSMDVSKVRISPGETDGVFFTENGVGVIYGPNYPRNSTGPGRNQLFVSQHEWLKEKFLEWSKTNA